MKIFKDTTDLIKNIWRINKITIKEKRGLFFSYNFIIFLSSFTPFLESGAIAIVINEIVKTTKEGSDVNTLFWPIMAMIIAMIIPSLLWKIENYLDLIYYLFIEEKTELLTVKKYSEIDLALHENPKYKDLFNKISENGNWRVCNFADSQFYILKSIIEVILASSIIIYSNPSIFLLIFLGTIPELIAGIYYGKRVWTIHTSKAETKRRFWDIKNHFMGPSSLIELRLFQNSEYFFNIIKDLFLNFRKEEYKNNKKNFITQIFSTLLSQLVLVSGIIYFILEVVAGKIQVGTLVFIMTSIQQLRGSLSGLFRIMGKQYQDSLFVTDFFEFLDIKTFIKKPRHGIIINPKIAPEIIFDNVSFKYPNSDKLVIKNFSLKIESGSKIALIGVNGAGKTTFVKLLCRFYDPTEGRITVNGHDLKDIDIESWYYLLGAVFQDYSRYHFQVKEAIAIGRTGKKSSLEKVIDAAKASEADIFIEKWEKSYEQNLGVEFTEGVEPSVGQWQKLALARTFYRDPKLMILDEPTSSIDANSETKIFERIGEVSDNRTVIIISHRFSTVKKANKIVVISDGEKIEEGNHETLIQKKGIYEKLFNMQAKSYQE